MPRSRRAWPGWRPFGGGGGDEGLPRTPLPSCFGPFVPENSGREALAGAACGPKDGKYGEADLTQAQQAVASFTITPRLSGTVGKWVDEQHTELVPVAGAAVWAVPSGGGDAITTVSDCDGNFVLPVAAGSYDVRADVAGDLISPRLKQSVDVTSTSACISFIIAADATPGPCN